MMMRMMVNDSRNRQNIKKLIFRVRLSIQTTCIDTNIILNSARANSDGDGGRGGSGGDPG